MLRSCPAGRLPRTNAPPLWPITGRVGPEEIRAYQQVYLTDTKRSVDQSVSAEHLAASLREAVRAQDLVMSH